MSRLTTHTNDSVSTILVANPVTATATDLAAWETLTIGTVMQTSWDDSSVTAITKVGLFGVDLTDFLASCD